MAKVIIHQDLKEEIYKKFKDESLTIFKLMESMEENPKKGKVIGVVGSSIIGEIKYKLFRFYYVSDGYRIKMLSISQLHDLVIKFVRMSEKKDQQKTIEEIKKILRNLGEQGF